jgi:hypothetical protein
MKGYVYKLKLIIIIIIFNLKFLRYSREVGSHQIDLGHLLDRGPSDLSSRYQPDPTFKPRGPSGR